MRIHKDFVKAFMQYSEFAQAPEKFLRWSALSIIAGALERKVWLSNGATTFYPNLYIMLVGDAGTRKSSSAHLAVEILREVPEVRFMAARINEASFMRSLTLAGEHKAFEYHGEKYKHSAVYLWSSEAANSFSPMYQGGGIVIPLTDVFNCEPLGWSKTKGWDKHTMKDGIISVMNPCVNMLACSTPAWFSGNVMSRTDAEAGFGSRLLLVVQKERIEREYGWNETNAANHKLKMELVSDLRHINKLQGPFSVDTSFKVAYAKYDQLLNEFLTNEMISPLMTGYYERKLTHTTKLALVLACSKRDDLILTGEDLHESWELVGSLEEQMTKAYISIGSKDPTDELTHQIIKYFKSSDLAFTKSNLFVKFKTRYPVKDLGKALDQLIRTGQITYVLTGQGLKEPTFEIVSSNVLNQLE